MTKTADKRIYAKDIHKLDWNRRHWNPEMTVEEFVEDNVDGVEDYIAEQNDYDVEELHDRQLVLQGVHEPEIIILMSKLYESYLLKS